MANNISLRLRPLRISEILDEAVELYKQNAGLFIGISAILYIPTLILNPTLSTEYAYIYAQNWKDMLGILASLGWYILLAGPIITGALTYGISERYLGNKVRIRDCFAEIMKARILTNLVVTNLITLAAISVSSMIPLLLWTLGLTIVLIGSGGDSVGIFVMIAAVVSIAIPAYVTGRLILAIPSVILENRGIGAALSRSGDLSKHRTARIFITIFIVMLVTSIIQAIISVPGSYASAMSVVGNAKPDTLVRIFNSLLQAAVSAVFMPASSIVVFLLYIDCRIRDEGYDLSVMADEITMMSKK